jgi:hypothetical protein
MFNYDSNKMKIKKAYLKWSLLVAAFILLSCSKTEPDLFGNINGIVTDSKSGEPVRAASVTLSPGGVKTTTGSDGRYEYLETEAGQYTVQVMKDGYQTVVFPVTVQAGVTKTVDIPLAIGVSSLAVNKSTLNMGTNTNLATFTVLNTGSSDLAWQIEYDCEWIESISPSAGTTKANGSTSVSVKIDRSKLTEKKTYTYSFIITSSGGSTEVTVSAASEEGGGGGNNGGSGSGAVTNGLLGYYTFDDGTANDMTDNELNGNFINSPEFVSDTPDGQGKAVFLNKNKDQYLNIPYNPFNGKFAYSISFWIKDFGNQGVIFSVISGDIHYNHPCLETNSSGKFIFYGASSGSEPFDYGISTIQDGKWHMVTITVVASVYWVDIYDHTALLYVDGKQVDINSVNGGMYRGDRGTKIQFGGNGGYDIEMRTSMKLDNIRFYDRTLNANDVKAIYEYEAENK